LAQGVWLRFAPFLTKIFRINRISKITNMDTVEKKVFDALAQKSCTVTLGGKEFEFRPMSLSDRQEISVISENLPPAPSTGGGEADAEGEQDVLKDAIAAGKYARQIAEIISVGAHVRGDIVRKEKIWFGLREREVVITEAERRQELFRYAYEHASFVEVYEAVKQVFVNSHPAFFLNITTSLCPKNMLKPTKETAATAPGQSKPE
jgi:hypothetical protein